MRQRIRQREICWSAGTQSDADNENGIEKVPDTRHELDAEVVRTELHERLQTVILRLSPEQQQIIQYYVVEERSAREVAAFTGRTPHAVRQAASTALKRLRGLLERQGFDESEAKEYLAGLNRTGTAREPHGNRTGNRTGTAREPHGKIAPDIILPPNVNKASGN